MVIDPPSPRMGKRPNAQQMHSKCIAPGGATHWLLDTDEVAGPVVIVETPCLAAGVLDILEMGDSGVLVPNLTATPGSDIEYVIESGFDHAAMADGDDHIFPMVLH